MFQSEGEVFSMRTNFSAAIDGAGEMRRALRIVLAASLFLFAAWPVQATPLTWTLQDVRFDDGGLASGFFVFDPETIEFDQGTQEWTATPPTIFDIETTGPVVGGEFRYQPPQPAFICESHRCSDFGIYFGTFLILVLEFDAPLPVAGGTVPVGGKEMLFEEFGFVRQISSGSVTTLSEPVSYALLGLGLSLLAVVRSAAQT